MKILFKKVTKSHAFRSDEYIEAEGELIGTFGEGSSGFLEYIVLFENKLYHLSEHSLLAIDGVKLNEDA